MDEQHSDWVSLGSPAWDRERFKFYVSYALSRDQHEADDLTAVVVTGTLVEYYLRHLVSVKCPATLGAESEGKPPPPFGKVLRLAREVGSLPDWIVRPLQALMTLRNRYAHEIAYTLQDSDIRALRGSVDATPLRADWDELERQQPPQQSELAARRRQLRLFIACLADGLQDVVPMRSTRT